MPEVSPFTADSTTIFAGSRLATADGYVPTGPLPRSDFVRRTGEDYAEALGGLFPTGAAWPRDPKSALMMLVAGLGQVWGRVDGRAADLLETETDPRITTELLEDWERAFGLPDPCVTKPLTVIDRRNALLNKMTTIGGQSRPFFYGIAAALGYTITIVEWSPYQGGISRAGDTRPYTGGNVWFRGGVGGGRPGIDPQLISQVPIVYTGPHRWYAGGAGNRAWWRVLVTSKRFSWFRGGSGMGGRDPHLRIMPEPRWFKGGNQGGNPGVEPHLQLDIAEDLECVFRRWAPGHSIVTFDYSGLPLSAY